MLGIFHIWLQSKNKKVYPPPPCQKKKTRFWLKIQKKSECDRTSCLPILADIICEPSVIMINIINNVDFLHFLKTRRSPRTLCMTLQILPFHIRLKNSFFLVEILCIVFSEASIWYRKLVKYVNHIKSILMKNRPTNQTQIICR